MSEAVNITSTKTWVGNFLTPQTFLWILAGFVSLVIFWKDSHDNWDKTERLEQVVATKADNDDLKALKEQVNRIYTTMKEDRAAEGKQIEEALDWIEFEKGRQSVQKK
jgi:hypothetical protein